MSRELPVSVVGGGAAGAAAALRLRMRGLPVVVIEKSTGRPHKFCGEFVSGEALETLSALDALDAVRALAPVPVRRMGLYGALGGTFRMPLAAGGWGLTRQALDAMLLDLAAERGAEVVRGAQALEVRPDRLRYRLRSGEERALEVRAAVGAWGRRSPLDRGRPFLARESPWVGVKIHYRDAPPGDEVGLYLFAGGHCGFVSAPGGLGTLGVLARDHALREAGGPRGLIRRALTNPALAARIGDAVALDDTLLTIARTPFSPKEPVAGGVLLVGDAAGLTPPFLGIGVANALRTGVEAADLLASRPLPEAAARYRASRRRTLRRIRWWSRPVSRIFCEKYAGDALVRLMGVCPPLTRALYRSSRARLDAGNNVLDREIPLSA